MRFKLIEEFKEFAVKGNMIDIAVGVIIGTAFNKVINTLVKEIFLPPLSLLTDGINWENKKWILRRAVTEDGVTKPEEIAIGYGQLLEAMVDFLIIGFTIFLVVKIMNAVRKKAEDPKNKEVKTPKDIELLHQVTELLEKQNGLIEKQIEKENRPPSS